MNFLFSFFIFLTNQLHQVRGQTSKTFCVIQNIGVVPAINYKTMNTQSDRVCALFCLLDKACKGSEFTGDTCHLVSQFVQSSDLQDVSGYEFLTPTPIYSGKMMYTHNLDQEFQSGHLFTHMTLWDIWSHDCVHVVACWIFMCSHDEYSCTHMILVTYLHDSMCSHETLHVFTWKHMYVFTWHRQFFTK